MLTRGVPLRAFVVPAILALATVRPAAAQSNVPAAAKAFSLGQQAELAGDFRAASEHYELADRMVPSPEALRSAARARMRAGDEAAAATHAEALDRRYSDERSHKIAEEILSALRPKLGRVSLSCTPACAVLVDGGANGVEEGTAHVFYVDPGRHAISGSFGTRGSQQEMIEAQAGKEVTLSLTAAEPEEAAPVVEARASLPPPRPTGLPRGWFIAGAALTVGLAGATIWSGLDVLDKNKVYEEMATEKRLEEGQNAELRTNILLGATAAAAVATGFIAWKTRWSSRAAAEKDTSIAIAPSEGGAVLVFGGQFQ
jgi:hypothetical protein